LLRSFMAKNDDGKATTEKTGKKQSGRSCKSKPPKQSDPLLEHETSIVKHFTYHYRRRNIICLVVSALLAIISIIFLIHSKFYQSICSNCNQQCDQCQIPDHLRSEYHCVVIALDVALATAITLVVLLAVQVGIFLCFLLGISEKHDLDLLQKFAEKSSEKETWQTFRAWIDALKQEPANIARQAENNFQRAIDERDVDFFYFVQNT